MLQCLRTLVNFTAVLFPAGVRTDPTCCTMKTSRTATLLPPRVSPRCISIRTCVFANRLSDITPQSSRSRGRTLLKLRRSMTQQHPPTSRRNGVVSLEYRILHPGYKESLLVEILSSEKRLLSASSIMACFLGSIDSFVRCRRIVSPCSC